MQGQLSQQGGHADIAARIEGAGHGPGEIHVGMIGDGAHHQERQSLILGDTAYRRALHVEGDVSAGLMQMRLLAPGADDVSAFTNRRHMPSDFR